MAQEYNKLLDGDDAQAIMDFRNRFRISFSNCKIVGWTAYHYVFADGSTWGYSAKQKDNTIYTYFGMGD